MAITPCNSGEFPPGGHCSLSENLTLPVAETRQISPPAHNSLITRHILKLCTLLALLRVLALKGRRRLRFDIEETMLKANRIEHHEGVALIANDGAAARFALGLLVVVVLLLSGQ